MKVFYLDESGNHDLNPKKIDPHYPIFALGGVIVDRAGMHPIWWTGGKVRSTMWRRMTGRGEEADNATGTDV